MGKEIKIEEFVFYLINDDIWVEFDILCDLLNVPLKDIVFYRLKCGEKLEKHDFNLNTFCRYILPKFIFALKELAINSNVDDICEKCYKIYENLKKKNEIDDILNKWRT